MPELRCPICNSSMKLASASPKDALLQFPHFPFCQERCKLIDLGHWFDENYGFTRPMEDDAELTD